MSLLWDDAPQPAADLTAQLADDPGWSASTVKTLLGRLVKKGVVRTTQDGNRFFYRPAVTRDRAVKAESRSFIDRVFGGDAAQTAAHLIRSQRMTPEQLDELRQLLDDRTPGR